MIVVDSNVIAYLYLPTKFSALSEKLYEAEPDWVAPLLWRSELRNILALYLRKKIMTLTQAYEVQLEAEGLLAGQEFEVPSLDVLKLAEKSGCSAYDCEFVALAQQLDTQLITADRKLSKKFPEFVIPLAEYDPGQP